MKLKLKPLPLKPQGVKYALKVPQSVLFSDLSLRGSLALIFAKVFGVQYQPEYISIDNDVMHWDYSADGAFNKCLCVELNPEVVAQKFITTVGRTSRNLIRTAQVVSIQSRWREEHFVKDLLADLNTYWDAYEEHHSTLFTFWSVENLLTNSLVEELKKGGFQQEIDLGLATFIVPSEPNWFMTENRNLVVMKQRGMSNETAMAYADMFAFLLTPFNLGKPPTAEDIIKRMKGAVPQSGGANVLPPMTDFPEHIVRLGELVRELTFWKTERIDTFALSDQIAMPMYKAVAEVVKLPVDLVFCMTRDEITKAIRGKETVPVQTLKQRRVRYCLALIDGKIDFYMPTEVEKQTAKACKGDVLKGMPTSQGVVKGRVKIIEMGATHPKVNSDEIIVATMTRPEMGGVLDVALAYITDEGGRLCHAAIVSREKKKPCVVGLGNATHVLRDGMMIEVDGTNGTVTVIEE